MNKLLQPKARDFLVQPCCGTNERAACNISLRLVSVIWSSLQSHINVVHCPTTTTFMHIVHIDVLLVAAMLN